VTDFPIIVSANRKPDRFLEAVATAYAAHQNGAIPNPLFLELKGRVNSLLEDAWEVVISSRFVWSGLYLNLPADVHDFYNSFYRPSLHAIPGMLAKVQTCGLKHPLIDAMRDFLVETKPLADLFADLKTMVGKRQPKAKESVKAKYDAPAAGHAAIGIVKALLEEITESSYRNLVSYFEDSMRGLLNRYLQAQTNARAVGDVLPLDVFYGTRRDKKHYNPAAFALVSRLVEHSSHYQPDAEVKAKADVAEIITKLAHENADQVREAFVYKNLTKIDSILEAKGNFDRAEIIGREINMGALRGSLRFFFKDGAHFVVQNSVVWTSSIYGKQFCRYPLTFHDVVLANGCAMARPSEARMNTIFVGKV